MIFIWIIELLFAMANIGLIVWLVILSNKVVPPAQADFELFLYVLGVGGASVVTAIMFLIAGFLINIKTTKLLSLLKLPFALMCLFNIATPIIVFLIFPKG